MTDLKVVLEEWKGVPASLELSTDHSSDLDLGLGASLSNRARRLHDLADPPARRAQRNSVADLAALHRTQLESLWENVEGAQRFLPPVPGRHLIAESASFVELNAATYTPRQGVHLFLLNDALLVAVKKRSQVATPGGSSTPGGGGKTRLVADRCHALSEIVVVDLKDGGELTNAIKVKRGKSTAIFRSERPEDKRALLSAFKKVAEELMAKRRKQSIWEAETRKDVRPSTLLSALTKAGPRGSQRRSGRLARPAGVVQPVGALWLRQGRSDRQGPQLDRRLQRRAGGGHRLARLRRGRRPGRQGPRGRAEDRRRCGRVVAVPSAARGPRGGPRGGNPA